MRMASVAMATLALAGVVACNSPTTTSPRANAAIAKGIHPDVLGAGAITGPDDIETAGTYSWVAHPSGGSGYVFKWFWRDAGNQGPFFIQRTTSDTLHWRVGGGTGSFNLYYVVYVTGDSAVSPFLWVVNDICPPNC